MALTIPFEAYELSAWAKRVGAEDPLPYLRDMALIDTDMLRDIGTRVWGLEYRAAPIPDELVECARRMWDRLLEDVSPAWSNSIAYDNFRSHMETVRDAMIEEEAARFPTVGQALVAIAEAFEVTWLEIVSWIVSTLSLIVSIAGLSVSVIIGVTTAWTGAGAVFSAVLGFVSLIVGVAGLMVTYWNSVKPRLAALANAGSKIDTLATPRSGLENSPVPDAVEDWDRARRWERERGA
jgi:hypothetical protein